MSAAASTYEGWAILELMGHRRLGGYVSEAQIAGASLLRIDVYEPGVDMAIKATQFYAPGAIYAITPSTEETARRVSGTVAPVQRWELPALPVSSTEAHADRHMDELEIEAEAIEHEQGDDDDLQF